MLRAAEVNPQVSALLELAVGEKSNLCQCCEPFLGEDFRQFLVDEACPLLPLRWISEIAIRGNPLNGQNLRLYAWLPGLYRRRCNYSLEHTQICDE